MIEMKNDDNLFEQFPEMLKVKDVQKALGVGRSLVYKMIESGDLKCVRLGSAIRVPKPCLVELVAETCRNSSL